MFPVCLCLNWGPHYGRVVHDLALLQESQGFDSQCVCVCFLSQSKPLQCEQCVCVNECVNAGEPHFESLCVVCRVDLGPVFLQRLLYLNQHKHLFYIVL